MQFRNWCRHAKWKNCFEFYLGWKLKVFERRKNNYGRKLRANKLYWRECDLTSRLTVFWFLFHVKLNLNQHSGTFKTTTTTTTTVNYGAKRIASLDSQYPGRWSPVTLSTHPEKHNHLSAFKHTIYSNFKHIFVLTKCFSTTLFEQILIAFIGRGREKKWLLIKETGNRRQKRIKMKKRSKKTKKKSKQIGRFSHYSSSFTIGFPLLSTPFE